MGFKEYKKSVTKKLISYFNQGVKIYNFRDMTCFSKISLLGCKSSFKNLDSIFCSFY